MPEELTIGTKVFKVYDSTEAAEATGYSWSFIKSRIYDGTIPAIVIPSKTGSRAAKYYIPDYVLETIPSTCFRRKSGRPKTEMERGESVNMIDEADFKLATSGKYDLNCDIETISTETRDVNVEIGLMDRFRRLLRSNGK